MRLRPRHYHDRLKKLLKQFPAVCLLGPRQCGKTTFIKSALSSWRYLDLEKPSDRVKIADDLEGALHRWPKEVIFDEAQTLPELFSVLRSVIDEKRAQKGRFVLLGSASPSLITNISESLAGRIGFLDMSPFLLEEAGQQDPLWFRGGFPDAYLQNDDRVRLDWFEAYTRTFIERDLNQMGIEVESARMRTLWSMLAHHNGGIWNASEIASSLGISYHTVNRYVDILEQTFLVRKLRPYFVNLGKRLVKSPKIYIRDSGLLHYFLGIKTAEELDVHPQRGRSWEGFVIEQVMDHIALQSPGLEAFFFKTATGKEIDLLLKKGNRLIPIEIKLYRAPQKSDLEGLVEGMADLNLTSGFVVRPHGESYSLGSGIWVVTLQQLLQKI
jgi:predicted AAA+ superfamily ATPase